MAAKATAPLLAGLSLAAIISLYNFAGWFYLKRKETILNSTQITFLGFFQIFFDIVVITILIHVTGGILSPFTLLYLFGIILISFIAPEKPHFVTLTAFLVIIFYESLLALEFYSILPPFQVIKKGLEVYADLGFFLYFLLIFPTFALISIFLSVNIAQTLTKGRKSLEQRVVELNGVRRHLELALKELNIKTSEVSLLYEFATRAVYPLEQFAGRLAEAVQINAIEITILEEDVEKITTYGYPLPPTPFSFATLEIPLQHQQKILGKLKLIRFKGKEFSRDEKRILGIIADHLALEVAHTQAEEQRLKLENQLKGKIRDLETFHQLAVGRELKMMELEKEIGELRQKLSAGRKGE
ncbi:MAG: hypothetical protein ACPL4K_06665, partial [Candidatus Margulisiibacteriota bacterium]